LAEGGRRELDALFAKLKEKYGVPVFGRERKKLAPISDRPMSAELKEQLNALPEAPRV
jgi:hypothetical protein